MRGFNMMIMAFSSDWDLGRDTGKGNRGDWLGLGYSVSLGDRVLGTKAKTDRITSVTAMQQTEL
jgi:hypothetical protein